MEEEFKLKLCKLAIDFSEALARTNAFAVTLLNEGAPPCVLVEWITLHRSMLDLHILMASLLVDAECTSLSQNAANAAFQTHNN